MYIHAIEYTPERTPYVIYQANNQKLIQIHREGSINFQHNYTAIKNLSQNAYTVYIYLLMKSTHRIWALYNTEIAENTPVQKRAYLKAIQELQDKRYLIPKEIDLNNGRTYNINTFHLYEVPQLETQNAPH